MSAKKKEKIVIIAVSCVMLLLLIVLIVLVLRVSHKPVEKVQPTEVLQETEQLAIDITDVIDFQETESVSETESISDTESIFDSIHINEDGTVDEVLEEQPNSLIDTMELSIKAEDADSDFVIEDYDGYEHANALAEEIANALGCSTARCVNQFEMNHDTLQQICYYILFDEDLNNRYYFYVSVDGCWASKDEFEDYDDWM